MSALIDWCVHKCSPANLANQDHRLGYVVLVCRCVKISNCINRRQVFFQMNDYLELLRSSEACRALLLGGTKDKKSKVIAINISYSLRA